MATRITDEYIEEKVEAYNVAIELFVNTSRCQMVTRSWRRSFGTGWPTSLIAKSIVG